MRSRLDSAFLRVSLAYVAAVGALFVFAKAFADVPPDVAVNPQGFFDLLFSAVGERKWGLVAVLGTLGVVEILKRVAPKIHDKFGALLNSDRGGTVLALVIATLASLTTTAMASIKLTPKVVVDAVVTAAGAIGVYHSLWNFFAPADKKSLPGATTSPPPPPIVKAAVFLPILFMLACGTTYNKAYDTCAKNAAPNAVVQDVSNVPSQVSSVLSTNAAAGPIAAVLDALAALYQDGEFLISCATTAWDSTHPNAPASAREAIKTYKMKHANKRAALCRAHQ